MKTKLKTENSKFEMNNEPAPQNLNESRPILVMFVEDHPEYREIVEIALENEDDIEFVGTFGAAEVACRFLRRNVLPNPPDVILLDLNLPGCSGHEAIELFRELVPDTKIIVLTQSNQEVDIIRAISSGASGYLLKSATVKKIVEGVRGVMKGEATLDATVARFLLNKLRSLLPQESGEKLLTPREMEVLELLAEGMIKREIGVKLNVSTSTVSTHVVHIFEKLGVKNSPAAIARAFRMGILKND